MLSVFDAEERSGIFLLFWIAIPYHNSVGSTVQLVLHVLNGRLRKAKYCMGMGCKKLES
jgi:hypothetical protein